MKIFLVVLTALIIWIAYCFYKRPKRPILLVIVRHAESERNVAYKGSRYLPDDGSADYLIGKGDHKVSITARGRKQAVATGKAIREKFGVFDVVYDSGYKRTIETREAILDAYSEEERGRMKLRSSHLLRERDPGYVFNMTNKEAENNFPWLKEYWDTFGDFYSRPPGGKSQADVCDQIYKFIGMLFSCRAGKKVLIVTHGHTTRAFRFNLEKWTAEDYERNFRPTPQNCSATTYRYNEQTGRLELEKYNEVFWKEEELK